MLVVIRSGEGGAMKTTVLATVGVSFWRHTADNYTLFGSFSCVSSMYFIVCGLEPSVTTLHDYLCEPNDGSTVRRHPDVTTYLNTTS